MYKKFVVGEKVDDFVGHAEGTVIEIGYVGAVLKVFFNEPTWDEIKQFQYGEPFEIRVTELYDAIMFTFKIGCLNWMDAPYSPHLSKNLNVNELALPEEGQGLSLMIVLVDTKTGIIKNMRLVGLSTSFTISLFKYILDNKSKPFDLNQYCETLIRIYASYSTERLMELSNVYCKVH